MRERASERDTDSPDGYLWGKERVRGFKILGVSGSGVFWGFRYD